MQMCTGQQQKITVKNTGSRTGYVELCAIICVNNNADGGMCRGK